MGELFFCWVSDWRVLGGRLVLTRTPETTLTKAQPTALPAAEGAVLVRAPGAVGTGQFGPPVQSGTCACLRRELSGEPDAGNLHLRFDEGRVDAPFGVASLLLYRLRVGRWRVSGVGARWGVGGRWGAMGVRGDALCSTACAA